MSEVTGPAALERKAVLTLAMLIAIGVVITAYAALEEPRRSAARERQDRDSIVRGAKNFATLCYGCHGDDGRGAVVPGTDPPRAAPALDRPDLRPSDPEARKKSYDTLFKTVSRGRPNTPMPAWGQRDGGVLLDEHIHELVLLIMNGGEPVPLEGHIRPAWRQVAHLVEEHVKEGAPPPIPLSAIPPPPDMVPAARAGLELWRGEAACIGCHTVALFGGGQAGPDLSNVANVAAQRKPGMSAEEYIRESILNPNAYVVQGFAPAMPSFQGRFTDEQLNSLVAFYMTLKSGR